MLDAKYWIYKNGWWLVPVAFIVVVILLAAAGLYSRPGMIVVWLAVPALAFFFFQKHSLNERKSILHLQAAFYEHFAGIYPKLNTIVRSDFSNGLTTDQISIVMAYLDLCSEAYWYYSNGLIAPPVWRAWVEKMRVYYYQSQIRPIWEKELSNEGHYGFNTQIIR